MATERELIEAAMKTLEWDERGQHRGRPSCPCGFIGSNRTIIAHRTSCWTWKAGHAVLSAAAEIGRKMG